MFNFKNVVTGLATGIVLSLGSIAPAMADDSEIYLTTGPAGGVRPNVLLIVDTSRSMEAADSTNERQPEYNPNGSYTVPAAVTPNNCVAGRIFFRRKGDPQPDCTSTNYILETSNNCSKLATATLTGAGGGRSGRWTGKAAQWDAVTNSWSNLVGSGTADPVECAADSGVHGANPGGGSNLFAKNGDAASKWTSLLASSIEWGTRTTYTFYSWKYLSWYAATPPNTTVTRIQAVENAVVNLVSSTDGINMGMMRFNTHTGNNQNDSNYKGGMVTNAIQNIETNRAALITAITNTGPGFGVCGVDPNLTEDSPGYCPNTGTMSSETLWEAHQYWSGGTMWSGNVTGKDPVFTSNTYPTPITSTCQKNFQILLTDGRPSVDNEADTLIEGKYGSSCTGNPGTGNPPSGAGRCLDELAGYMHRTTTDLVPTVALPGNQTVTTHTIAFGQDVAGADFLTEVATAGGGRRFNASNSSQLQDIFDEITAEVLDVATTFSTASVSVNAFNRTASRNELYFALFAPEDKLRWDGNLKKYKMGVIDRDGPTGTRPPEIIVTGQGTVADAINPTTGFFQVGTRSFWSTIDDGNVVTDGGAASRLPAYGSRVIKTYLGSNPLTPITDAAVTFGMLGAVDATDRGLVLDFMRARNEQRMGDPMHSVPQVVTYGGSATAPIDVVYVATNDGFLHAINAADNSGQEMWSFVPEELLGRQKLLMTNPALANRTYGLDGDIRVLRYDINSDGTIDATAGDRVYLYVGMRRGGRFYYALDVTDRNNPSVLWRVGPGQLPGVGETWSPPTIARVNISGAAQNGQKFVLIFGGGYDDGQEDVVQADDDRGNRIYMLDAKSGALLWYAGKSLASQTPAPNLDLASMTNSIPGKITVMDLDGDLLADRMYAADTGGRVFRFDITNGNPVGSLVTGGVFANLGQGNATGGSVSPSTMADTRRFYNAPDVTLIQSRGAAPYMSVAIGSGYRGHPLNRQTTDRFYALRDLEPFRRYSNAEYTNGTVTTITESNLYQLPADTATSNVPISGPLRFGWKLVLPANTGEKVLSDATTAGGVVMFTTYQPLDPDPTSDACRSRHRNRAYAINIGNGRPALDFDGNNNLTNADLFEVVNHDGILGGVNIAVLRGEILDEYKRQCGLHANNPCTEDQAKLACIAGMHVLGRCVNIGDGGRSYWRKQADSGS